jgi:hypothetical protein
VDLTKRVAGEIEIEDLLAAGLADVGQFCYHEGNLGKQGGLVVYQVRLLRDMRGGWSVYRRSTWDY